MLCTLRDASVCLNGCRSLLATSGVFGPLLLLLVTQLLTSALSPLSNETSLSTTTTTTTMTTDSRNAHATPNQEAESTEASTEQVDVVMSDNSRNSESSGTTSGAATKGMCTRVFVPLVLVAAIGLFISALDTSALEIEALDSWTPRRVLDVTEARAFPRAIQSESLAFAVGGGGGATVLPSPLPRSEEYCRTPLVSSFVFMCLSLIVVAPIAHAFRVLSRNAINVRITSRLLSSRIALAVGVLLFVISGAVSTLFDTDSIGFDAARLGVIIGAGSVCFGAERAAIPRNLGVIRARCCTSPAPPSSTSMKI